MKLQFAKDAAQYQKSWAVCSRGTYIQDTRADQVTVDSVDGLLKATDIEKCVNQIHINSLFKKQEKFFLA